MVREITREEFEARKVKREARRESGIVLTRHRRDRKRMLENNSNGRSNAGHLKNKKKK